MTMHRDICACPSEVQNWLALKQTHYLRKIHNRELWTVVLQTYNLKLKNLTAVPNSINLRPSLSSYNLLTYSQGPPDDFESPPRSSYPSKGASVPGGVMTRDLRHMHSPIRITYWPSLKTESLSEENLIPWTLDCSTAYYYPQTQTSWILSTIAALSPRQHFLSPVLTIRFLQRLRDHKRSPPPFINLYLCRWLQRWCTTRDPCNHQK